MNPNQILHDIYALIDKGLINDAFAKIAEIYDKIPPFADLQGEYIAGKDNAKFADRLKTYASHIAQTQTPLQQKIGELEAELDALKHTEERLKRANQSLDNAKNEALNDYEEAHTKVLQHERALKQKQAEIESLKNQLTQTQQNPRLQTEFKEKEEQIQNLQKALGEGQLAITSLKNQLKNTQQSPRLQTELEEKEDYIQTLQTTIQNLQEALAEGQLAYEKLHKEHTKTNRHRTSRSAKKGNTTATKRPRIYYSRRIAQNDIRAGWHVPNG